MSRPKLDMIFDSTIFIVALVSTGCLILVPASPIFIGFMGGLVAVTGFYAIRSLILWKKHHHIVMHDAWILNLRDMMVEQRDQYRGSFRIRYSSGSLSLSRFKRQKVNWRRDGF